MVVGNGMVGARFCDEVRRRDSDGRRVAVTVLGAESRPAYNRVLLSTVLAGGLTPQGLTLPAADVTVRLGVTVTAIDRERRTVATADGGTEPYDALVLATGCRPVLPSIPGLGPAPLVRAEKCSSTSPRARALFFRTLDDCDRILARARPGARFAVLGGGLLGCEAARGLAGRGVRVTLVHRGPHLMERQLDAGAGAVLAVALERLGVRVLLGARPTAWEPGEGLRTEDGPVAADTLVVAAGVRAETGLASDAGLAVDGGVLVDDRLATSDDRVHAIGDCARHAGAVAGVVQPGWEQAAVLADLLTGADPAARYRGTRTVTRLKARDVDLATVGDPALLGPASLRFADPDGGRYAALAFDGDRVVAGAVLGLPDAAASMIQFFDAGIPVAPEDRLALLLGRALPAGSGGTFGSGAPETADPGRLPNTAVVCRCNTVTKGALVTAWRAGATTAPALARATRAGTGCGSCGDTVAGICAWLRDADPSPAQEEAA